MLVVGNWKMNLDLAAARQLSSALVSSLGRQDHVEVGICPPFVALDAVYSVLHGSGIRLGAQNMHEADNGAFTGEVSAPMLRAVGCHYVILGHSERRQFFVETDAGVSRKAVQARAHRLVPIVCVGESLPEREAEQHETVVQRQLRESLENVELNHASELVVAYEPVWAIGTGRTASPEQVEAMHGHIRRQLEHRFGRTIGAGIAILYGGSVKPDNAADLFDRPDVDGGLIGGASLKADDFLSIVQAARR
ncbi:MAG: triose-phosphate isomerase [Bacteroidetes bacterium]|nr:triose-phosphate isomerase [Bacteroidota bacterium]